MSKWTVVRDNSLGKCAPGSIKALTKATKMSPSLSVKQMKEQSEAFAAAKIAREEELVKLAEAGTLKSARLLKEVEDIKARKAEKVEKVETPVAE